MLHLCYTVFPVTSASGNVPVTRNSAFHFIYCTPINVPSGIKPPINSARFIEWRSDVTFDRVADVHVVTRDTLVFIKFLAISKSHIFIFAAMNLDYYLGQVCPISFPEQKFGISFRKRKVIDVKKFNMNKILGIIKYW